MNRFLSAVAAALIAVSPAFAADKFKLDGENTKIEFTGTKKDGKHTGGFRRSPAKLPTTAAGRSTSPSTPARSTPTTRCSPAT